MENIVDLEDYNTQLAINNQKMEGMLKAMFPDLKIPYEDIYNILLHLEESQVNGAVIPKVIRGIHNIVIGTGKGQVVIHVNDVLVNVSVREQDEELKTKVEAL
jgi:hypothetical protein